MANIKDQEDAHKEQFELKIKELETEIKKLKSAEREPVVVSCNHEEEMIQLQVIIYIYPENCSLLQFLQYMHTFPVYQLDGIGAEQTK